MHFDLGQTGKTICDDCDVRHKCVTRLLVKEMDSCLLFNSCSAKVENEVVDDLMREDESPEGWCSKA